MSTLVGRSLIVIPSCPANPGHGKMQYISSRVQDQESALLSVEQREDGAWYLCEECYTAVLFMSARRADFVALRRERIVKKPYVQEMIVSGYILPQYRKAIPARCPRRKRA